MHYIKLLLLYYIKSSWSYKVCKFLADLGLLMHIPIIDAIYAKPFTDPTSCFPSDASKYLWDLQLDTPQIIAYLTFFWRTRILGSLVGNPRTTSIYPKFHAYVGWVGLPIDKQLPFEAFITTAIACMPDEIPFGGPE